MKLLFVCRIEEEAKKENVSISLAEKPKASPVARKITQLNTKYIILYGLVQVNIFLLRFPLPLHFYLKKESLFQREICATQGLT